MTLKPRDPQRLRKLARGADRIKTFGAKIEALAIPPAELDAFKERFKAHLEEDSRASHRRIRLLGI